MVTDVASQRCPDIADLASVRMTGLDSLPGSVTHLSRRSCALQVDDVTNGVTVTSARERSRASRAAVSSRPSRAQRSWKADRNWRQAPSSCTALSCHGGGDCQLESMLQ